MSTNPSASFILTVRDLTRQGFNSVSTSVSRFAAQAERDLKKLADDLLSPKGLAGAALATGALLAKAIKDGVDYADSIGKAADRVGIGAEKFSELAFAASKAEVDLESFTKSLVVMQQGILKTTASGGQLSDELKDLGINIQSLRGLDAQRQFELVASALSQVDDEAEQTRLGIAIFGKEYKELIQIIKQGPDAFKANELAAKQLGLVLTDEMVQKLGQADEAFNNFGQALKGLELSIATALAEPVTAITQTITGFNQAIIQADTLAGKVTIIAGKLAEIAQNADLFARAKNLGLGLGGDLADKITGRDQPTREPLGGPSTRVGKRPPINSDVSIDDLAFDREGFKFDSIGKDARKEIDKSVQEGVDAALAGFDQIRESFGTLSDDQIDAVLERQAKLQDQLAKDVVSGAEAQTQIAEQSISESLDRVQDKFEATSDFLRGATERFGASVQDALSDVFFNAGEGADKFADTVLNAFKRILADAAAKKTVDLIASLFNGGKTSTGASAKSSATGGFVSAIVGALFGGARAEGGPVSSGKAFLVGERGPELFMPGGSGQIVPNAALARAGGSSVNIVNNFDLRGSTKDSMDSFMQRLLVILRRNKEEVKAEIRQDINRQRFGLGKGG